MPNFSQLLDKPVEDAVRPKTLPAGTYEGIITKHEFGESKEKKTPYCRVHLRLTGPGEDIDPAELDGIDLTKKTMRRDYYLTEDAVYRLRELLESCSIPIAGRSFSETIPELTNQPVLIAVTQRPGTDPSRTNPDGTPEMFNDVANVKGVS